MQPDLASGDSIQSCLCPLDGAARIGSNGFRREVQGVRFKSDGFYQHEFSGHWQHVGPRGLGSLPYLAGYQRLVANHRRRWCGIRGRPIPRLRQRCLSVSERILPNNRVNRLRVALLTSCVMGIMPLSSGCATTSAPTQAKPDAIRQQYSGYLLKKREWEARFVDCAEGEGLRPTQDPFGGWQGFAVGNRPSVGGLDKECLSRSGDPPSAPPVDKRMISEYYYAELRQYECLLAHGYPVIEPPTVEAFVQGYESGPVWTALAGTVGLYMEDEYEVLLGLCPVPDPWELFGPTPTT